jgi:hypothetical protein
MRSQLSHDTLKPLRLTSHDVKCVVEGMAYIVTVKTLTKLDICGCSDWDIHFCCVGVFIL